jgi:hypothetical protein
LLLHRVPEPSVVRRTRVVSHEGLFDGIVAGIDLSVSVELIVVPSPSAPSQENSLDAQQMFHLPWLENPTLRVD